MKKIIMSLGLFLLAPTAVFGQAVGGQGGGQFENLTDLAFAFKGFLDILTGVIIALALVFFIWGLALFILSAGDEEKREKGKKIMIWGIVAFTVMIAVWGIVTFLIDAFGIGGQESAPFVPGVPDSF